MNKLLEKVAKVFLGLSMAAGVGVAIGSNQKAQSVSAASAWQAHTGSLTAGEQYLIVSVSGSYCMKPTNTSTTGTTTTAAGGYSAVSFTASSGPDLGFVFSDAGSGKFYIMDGTRYVRANGTTNNGLAGQASQDSTNNGVWTVTETSTSGQYTIINENTRQISLYGTSNWRSYGSNSGSKTNVKIYEKAKITQTITASATTAYSDESVTLTTNATTATWSITSGSSYAHLSSTSGKSVSLVGDASGSVTVKAVASGYTDATKTITFNERPTGTYYDVTFNSNGGSSSPAKESIKENETFTFPSPGTKTHYSFLGWSSDGGTTKYATGATSPAVTSDITYTAYWQEDAKYTVTYVKGDHGTGSNYVVTNQYAGSYTLATFATAGFTADDGYKFSKWSVGGVQYSEGASITLSANTTVTAIYSEIVAYTLVTDPSTLQDGTEFVLVDYVSSTYRIAKDLNSGHIKMNTVTSATTVSGTTAGSTVETEEADVFTLVGSTGAWEIKRGDTYLQFTGTSNGNDSFTSTSSADTKFSIVTSSTSNKLTINSNSRSSRALRYNTGTGDLRNYANTGSQLDLYMYAIIPASNDTTTALSISACSDEHYSSQNSTWTGYDTYTLDVSSFTISCTTTKSTPAEGYSFKGIGYMNGDNFVARLANFSSGHPTAADTRLCWQAKYPTTAGGSTYLSLYVILSVTADSVSSLAITGSMTKTSYAQNEAWDPTGFTVNAYYASASSTPVDVTNDANLSWSYSPATTASLDTTSVTCTASFGGQTAVSSAQEVTVSAEPVTITISGAGSSGTTQWKPTSSGSTFTDSAGNTATITTDVPTAGWSGSGTPYQMGSNANKGTYVLISIRLASRSGVTAAGIKYCSNGGTTVDSLIYGDSENDVILRSSVTGNTAEEKKTTDSGVNYETINASTINFKLSFSVGCKIGYVSYTLGSTVTEFETFTSLAIQTPTTDTQFRENDTFSASNLVLRATDQKGFTKDFTSGLLFGTYEGDNSFSGATLTAGEYTVYVTLTIGGITKSVHYDIEVTEIPTYSLVSDLSTLYEGAKVLIVSGTNAAGPYGDRYLTSETVTFTNNDITDSGSAIEFTVRIFGNKIAFQFGDHYLSYSGSLNQIQRSTVLSIDCAFYNDGTGLLSNVDGRYLQYCSSLSPSGFVCLTDGYTGASHVSIYISDKAPKTSTLGAETFAYKYLHMRDYTEGDGSCMNDSGNHYYSTAKAFYTSASFSSDEKVEFAKITDAVARLQAWARANGETFDPSAKTFSENPRVSLLNVLNGNTNTVAIIVIISMVSVTAIGGYFFLRKKKEQ